MRSRVKGYNYIFKIDDDYYPERANKKQTDKSLKKIAAAIQTINDEIAAVYENDYGLYKLIDEYVISETRMECDDGRCRQLEYALDSLKELQETLATHDDEITMTEESETLSAFGYKCLFSDDRFYEKIIEDSNEREVVDEIQFHGEKPVRRERTIVWKKVDGGRQSETITYKKLPISKKLMKAIYNSVSIKRDKD